MWRGYGNGGSGVAIVFDGAQVPIIENHALIVSPVVYGPPAEREKTVQHFFNSAARLALDWPSAQTIAYIASSLVERVVFATLFSKHEGFSDEKEWRVVYRPELDESREFEKFFGYHHTNGVMEPKLKLPIERIPGVSTDIIKVEKIVSRIIVGPVAAKHLVVHAFHRMLEARKPRRFETSNICFTNSVPRIASLHSPIEIRADRSGVPSGRRQAGVKLRSFCVSIIPFKQPVKHPTLGRDTNRPLDR
ncbi:MAG: DUF2971 domain-containing protein [Nitrospiraceae bacterium]|nr:DUF2971 domain-containing protein [Nitrospiraceae bacterium]